MAEPPEGSLTPRPRSRRRMVGEMLVERGVITPDQLEAVLERQKREKGSRMGRLLVDLGMATEAQIADVIADQLRIPAADLAAAEPTEGALALLSRELAVKHVCLPWFVEGRELYLIMADPTNAGAADAIAFNTGLKVRPVVAPESEVIAAIDKYYAGEETSLAQFENVDIDLADEISVVAEDEATSDAEADLQQVTTGPVVKLVNAILADAIRAGASDVHVEPQEKAVNLRYRVDGMLRQVMTMPKRVQGKVVSRIKVMSHMDISERRKPQDGRTFIRIGGKQYDLRVSSLPAAEGEKVVMRILVQARAQVSLEDLGFAPDVLARLLQLLKRPQGMILVTGPTGSGKTSTLYASLNQLRSETTNIVTVEDPIEYRLSGITQVAVQDKAGMTFAAGLRSILRQDPDIVMVGEVRDLETAQTAFQAAQTGHLVLTTLHTNDAPSAITRLVEMGVPAYVVASSLVAVMAQRLVRTLCDCKETHADGTATARGCATCKFTGYRGRTGVYELMVLTPRVKSVLLARATDDVVRRAATASGMLTMYADGLRKAAAGLTTPEEVGRVVPPDIVDEESADLIPEGAPLAADAATSRPPCILVVDDDAPLLEILRETLASERYEVVTAASGDDALALIYRRRPDLVITDLHMPKMGGLDLLKRIRADLSTCQIPVMFLSVNESPDAEMQALDLGADDYLSKPIAAGRLLSRVRRALFRSHLMRAGPAS